LAAWLRPGPAAVRGLLLRKKGRGGWRGKGREGEDGKGRESLLGLYRAACCLTPALGACKHSI